MAIQYRQGDVFLVKLDMRSVPQGAQKQAAEKRIVLAYGEVTGHAHAIDATYASLYEWKGDRLIEAKPGAKLVHEEHSTIALEPGFYRVIQQREYEPGSFRTVVD
ncbi:MAG: hypothetical protein K8F91_17145 [Candidatus Obscuribacterales bacterium]|nr:hypothetical protein [Candidatus Obscuribacterales bacterium]